jgi:LacI family transcriptional regulator
MIARPRSALDGTRGPPTWRGSMARTVKLEDVAAAAGVDKSTASRVLNNSTPHRVGVKTRERILAAAEQLGYTPNALARGLRTSRTFTLGIAVPQLENPVFAEIIAGASGAARARGYSLVISLVEQLQGEPDVYEKLANSNRVDGLLVATLEEDSVLRKALERASVPFVVVNRKLRGVDTAVAFDSFEAARASTEYLLSLGHRRIAHLAGRLNGYNGTGRLAGYRAALEAAGIEPDPRLVFTAGYTLEGGEQAARTMLASRTRPTAILAATVLSAAGALKALHSAGVDVPGEMSVMSIHDAELAEMLHPPLTAMRLPTRAMGVSAAEGLIDLIEGNTTTVQHVLPPEQLRVRASTSPPRKR